MEWKTKSIKANNICKENIFVPLLPINKFACFMYFLKKEFQFPFSDPMKREKINE